MQPGVTFPTADLGTDPVIARDFAQAAEDMGYTHLRIIDHVLGADVTHRDPKLFPYTSSTPFHEPLVFFGFLAGVTKRIGFVSAILVSTQRQTALVAKQAAEVDVLCGGRLRLGLGTGWNEVEYEALGEDFSTRGKRLDEQVAVLRALWTRDVVSFEGRWHRITAAGLNPLPVQRPIPIWFGGSSEAMFRRIGKLGDGWIPFSSGPDALGDAERGLARIHHHALEAGRDPESIGLDGRVWLRGNTQEDWHRNAEGWRALGCSHLAVNTTGAGFSTLDEHLNALHRFKETLG